jgi:hypothetical protein
MKKITLELDTLTVESFQTQRDPRASAGTVEAREAATQFYTCVGQYTCPGGGYTCWDSCTCPI